VLITSPTGSGKTRILAYKLQAAQNMGFVAWYVVHRRQLVHQTSRVLTDLGIPHTKVMAGEETTHEHGIYVISRDTYTRRKAWINIGSPALIVFDEAHIALKIQAEIAADFPRAVVVGYTATPTTMKGPAMGDVYQTLIQGPTYTELIKDGYLVRPEYWEAVRVDTSQFEVSRATGDYVQSGLERWLKKGEVIGSAVDAWHRIAADKATVIFAPGVAASKHVAHEFYKAGVPAAHIDWSTPEEERNRYLGMLADGRIKVVVNADLLSEGYDMPQMEAVMFLAPTKSPARYLQRLGRALRRHPGKEKAIVIDHAGVLREHGLHTDWEEWELEHRKTRAKKKKEKAKLTSAKSIVCPGCGYVFEASSICPQCGFRLTHSEDKKPLIELPGEVRKATGGFDEADAKRFYSELLAVAATKGYKPGWAAHAYEKKYKRYPRREWKAEVRPGEPSERALRWAKYLNIRRAMGLKKGGRQ